MLAETGTLRDEALAMLGGGKAKCLNVEIIHGMMAKSLSLCDRTLIMGILNGTPDSFSDGGKFNTPEAAAAHVTQMIEDGADIIDLGVESTRPGCTPLTADEEIERLSQLIDPVLHASTVPVSIDTYHAKTADYAFF